MLDDRRTFREHVIYVLKKNRFKKTRIMPNIGGPSLTKRIILNDVINSILLYGATKSKMLARVVTGYRTISALAAGVSPIALLIERRTALFTTVEAHIRTVKGKQERKPW